MHSTQLPVMESFYTLQGEGYHQGKAAYFIRLGGCDVGCVWCDVKESWDTDTHPKYSIEQIVDMALKAVPEGKEKIAVITGGEPLMHDLTELTQLLQQKGFKTHIETSGAHPVSGSWDWICLSPKKFKAPLSGILPLANELKVVIFNKSDFDWAESFTSQLSSECKLYLQPEWDKKEVVMPLIIDYIQQHPDWRLSLQIHKYIGVP
jgi:organic radical activating enzyme